MTSAGGRGFAKTYLCKAGLAPALVIS